MLRLTAEGVALFLLPFAIYAGLLMMGVRWPWLRQAGPGRHGLVLASCGVGLVALGFVTLGLLGGHQNGTYVPAHMEHGQLVPGRIE